MSTVRDFDHARSRRLVIVDSKAPAVCTVCGRALVRGTEARLLLNSPVHVACADSFAGPSGT